MKTAIEYLERVWNPSGWGCNSGCSYCYAWRMARRAINNCGLCNDFVPHTHAERLGEPASRRRATRYGVDFMTDLWAPWVDPAWQRAILHVIQDNPQHTFLVLTKHPQCLSLHNPWPTNTWVGVTITGAETAEQQGLMLNALHQVEGAGKRWVSYEPMLGPLVGLTPREIDWLVMGAQTGTGAVRPDMAWYYRVWDAWQRHPFPIWEKASLQPFLDCWRNG